MEKIHLSIENDRDGDAVNQKNTQVYLEKSIPESTESLRKNTSVYKTDRDGDTVSQNNTQVYITCIPEYGK